MVRNSILKKIVPFDGKIFYRNPSGLKKSFFVFFSFLVDFSGKLVWGCWRNSVLGIINFYTISVA
jgi:hypothetical protein